MNWSVLKNHGYLITAIAFVAGLALILSVPFTIDSHAIFSNEIKSFGNGVYGSKLIQFNSSGGTIVVFGAPPENRSGLINSNQIGEANSTNIPTLSIKPHLVSTSGNGTDISYYYENLPPGEYYFIFSGNHSNNLEFYWTYAPPSLNYNLYGGWGLVLASPVIGIVTYLIRKKSRKSPGIK